MFGEQFYPTPSKIIGKMLNPYLFGENQIKSNYSILEPSAGKGDILEYIQKRFDRNRECPNLYSCEIDPNLRAILQKKDFKIISYNFLEYSGDYIFDLIIMNPPFSNGDEHLLKAWDIIDQGDIVCLLNSETINNPYSQTRKLLKNIIDSYGTVEDLGNCFDEAERKTNVNVSLVRLKKISNKKPFDFEFEQVNSEKKFKIDESTITDAPALKDIIGNMIIQYTKVKETYVEFLKIREALRHYGNPLIPRKENNSWDKNPDELNENPNIDIIDLANHSVKDTYSKSESFNDFCDMMKSEMWSVIFQNLKQISSFNIEKLMTNSVRKNWAEFMKNQGAMDFTRENVWSVIETLVMNKNMILERSIVEVFDLFTKYYKENRLNIEGWKTNDSWKVNKKIILPGWLKMSWEKPADRMRWGAEYRFNYNQQSEYSDIDKALCYITGNDQDKILTVYDSLQRSFNMVGKVYKGPHKGECESHFFYIKYFMKGTIHLEFKDEKLWQEFNMRACADKNWLPPTEKAEWEKSKQKEKPKDSDKTQLLLL